MTARRSETLLVAGLVTIATFAQAATFVDVRFDDAFITYRYSQNLATGHGFVFNPGEHVLGTTSPGQALLGTVFYALVGKAAFPAVMAVLGCVGWSVQAGCAYALLREVLGGAAAAFVAIALAAGATRAYFWVPLETNLVAAFVLAAFVLASRRRWIACGVAGGIAVVFRPDALIACAVLGVLALLEERARAWRPAAAFLGVTATWAAIALGCFGTVVPQTLHAKLAHGSIGAYVAHAVSYPALSFAPWSRVEDSGTQGTWRTIVPMWGLAMTGVFLTARRSRVLAALAAYGALLTLAYVAMHPDPAFRWHLYPATLLFAFFALCAIAIALRRVPRLVAVPAACALVASFAIDALRFEEALPAIPAFGLRDRLEGTVAGYLAASAAPTDYVDAEEVGTVAYLSGLPMVDHPGLVSEDAVGQLFAAARGRPSRVRWAILNPWEAETAKATFAHFRCLVFEEGSMALVVCDLRKRVSGAVPGDAP